MWYDDNMRFKSECFKVKGRENDVEVIKRSKGVTNSTPCPRKSGRETHRHVGGLQGEPVSRERRK